MKLLNRLIIFLILLNTAACSFLVYQPSKKQFVDPAGLGFVYEELYLEAAGGVRLHSWFFPANPDVPERGTIVQFHGNAENMSTHFQSLIWLVNYGYNFLTFDYRGYGRSGGYPSQAGINSDALAVIEYAVTLKQDRLKNILGKGAAGKGHKLFLYGQSLGGAVLLRALSDVRDKGLIDGIIVESSFLSYREMAREKLSLTCLTWPLQPLSYLFSDKYAPVNTLGDLQPVPLLVIHGEDDFIVPIHHGERIFKLASQPKRFWRVESGRHIDAMLRPRYREKLLDYLISAGGDL